MALNVNIIGRDSEGNLRALKVNSEGNLEFGQLVTEIQAVKDNQGRLYGKYGEVWIPVKVDSEGRPIISSDVTINAEGLVVDLGQIKQGPAGTEPWPVQLSGNIVSKKHLNAPFGNRFYGENIASNIETVQPLVGSFKNMMIYIENNADARIAYLHVYGLIAGDLILLKALTEPGFEIAAGAKRLLTTNDEELGYLKDVPLEGLAIRSVFAASGTGTINVYLAGGE